MPFSLVGDFVQCRMVLGAQLHHGELCLTDRADSVHTHKRTHAHTHCTDKHSWVKSLQISPPFKAVQNVLMDETLSVKCALIGPPAPP